MILFEDNPKLRLKQVTTVRGDTEYRRNCRFINLKYYRVDRDCFQIDGRWYCFDTGNILFDHENKKWLLKKDATSLIKGVVDFEEDGNAIFGLFTPNPYNNVKCRVSNSSTINLAVNEEILLKNGYIEDTGSTVWYSKKVLGIAGVKKAKTIRNDRGFTDRGYNIEDNVKDFNNKVKHYDAYDIQISKEARIYAKYLGDLSFGTEIEIARGNLPDNLQNRYGVVICRDGSIDGGPELVTIPQKGAKGIQSLKDLCDSLYQRGEISIACALHTHIGGTRTDKLFLAAIYQLCRKIQNELFTMFPYYKTDHKGVKRKNYNQKLEGLSIYPLVKTDKESFEAYLVDTYAKVFDFLAEGRMTLDQFNKRTREHPIPRKWERSNRYYWANFMNMFFGNRHTCEFRLHQPTTNHHKVINWLFICAAIVKYADRYATEIITSKSDISVKDVLNIYRTLNQGDKNADFLSDYLYAYFLERQKEFQKDFKKGDKVSEWDMEQDKDYKFMYKGVCGLI
jgi:hypothetical protein